MIADVIRMICVVGAAVVASSLVGAFFLAYEQEQRAIMYRRKLPPDAQDVWDRFNADFPKERDQQLILEHLRRIYRGVK